MTIYTKTGDQGTTSDVLGQRISKGDLKIELQGSIDEVNAGIGHLRALFKTTILEESDFDVDSVLRDIQYTLFRIGSDVSSNLTYNYVKEEDISFLEQSIDFMTNITGPLNNFIYYSGSAASTYSHIIRSVIRRAERVFVRYLDGKDYNLDYQYINRLSDYFFTLSRYLNIINNTQEEIMKLR